MQYTMNLIDDRNYSIHILARLSWQRTLSRILPIVVRTATMNTNSPLWLSLNTPYRARIRHQTAIIAVSPEPEKYRVTVTKLTTSPSCETPVYRVYSVSLVQVGYLHLHLQLHLTWLCWQCDQVAFTCFLLLSCLLSLWVVQWHMSDPGWMHTLHASTECNIRSTGVCTVIMNDGNEGTVSL